MTYDARPIVRCCPHADCVKTKSRHYGNLFSTLKNESNDVVNFTIDKSFCLPNSEIPWEPTAALYDF